MKARVAVEQASTLASGSTTSPAACGTIHRYIDDYSVTGLTSNPSIYDRTAGSGDYDDAIRTKSGQRLSPEELFFELAIEDLRSAADLFLPAYERTDGVDGWVSLEVSPLLARQAAQTVQSAKLSRCRRRASARETKSSARM